MTAQRLVELAVAALLLGLAVWLYRRPSADGYGSQGAVLLLAVGAILAIHALGGLDYRPSASEIEARQR